MISGYLSTLLTSKASILMLRQDVIFCTVNWSSYCFVSKSDLQTLIQYMLHEELTTFSEFYLVKYSQIYLLFLGADRKKSDR